MNMSERDVNISRVSEHHVKNNSGGVAVSVDLITDGDRAIQRRRALIAERVRVLLKIGGLNETMASL